jgi:DNA-binding NarL/FixJ family response regulator
MNTVELVMQLFKEGKTIPAIAKKLELSIGIVRYIVNDQILRGL